MAPDAMWADYKRESLGLTVLSTEYGFAAYVLAPECLFIDEFYVVPERRKLGLGKYLLNDLCTVAHNAGLRYIRSTVSLASLTASSSLSAQLAVGFQAIKAENGSILLQLEVGPDGKRIR